MKEMTKIVRFMIFGALLFSSASANDDDKLYLYKKDAGNVLEHTDAEPMMAENGPKVVEFYSPFCGGCKAFRPKYVEMSKEIEKESNGAVIVYAVSCGKYGNLCQKYDLHGYPSILTFTKNDEKGTYMKRSSSLNPTAKYNGYEVKAIVEAALGGGGEASSTTAKEPSSLTTTRKTAEVNDDDKDDADTTAGGNKNAIHVPQAKRKAEGGADEDFKQSLKGAGAKKAAKKLKDMDKMKDIVKEKHMQAVAKKAQKRGGGLLQNFKPGNKKKSGIKGAKAARPMTPLATTTAKGDTKKGATTTPGNNKNAVPKAGQPKANPADVPAAPGDTKQMLANKPGTKEFIEKRDAIIKKVQKGKQQQKKGGGILRAIKPKPKEPQPLKADEEKAVFKRENLAKIEPKKQGFVERQVEKVPIIRQVVKKLTPEEELISDAALSFVESIKNDLYVGSSNAKGPMDTSKVAALKDWLQLLSISLPPEWGLHKTIDDLNHNINLIAENKDRLDALLKKHIPARKTWSRSCANGGFTCGLWKLIHIMSVGLAEHRGGLNLIDGEVVDVDTRVFSPMEAADTLRGYIDNFFSCNECREHFIGMYDECKFRRCDRLADEARDIEAEDWKQFALWLWEVHNDVSVRVKSNALKEKKKKAAEEEIEREAFISSLYPSIDQCIGCIDEDGAWIEPSVFAYLERAYWAEPDAKMDKLLYGASLDETHHARSMGILKFMIFFVVCLIIFLHKRLSTSSGIRQTLLAAKAVRTRLEDKIVGKQRKM